MSKCDECGRTGEEKEFSICTGCENSFCFNNGCKWLNIKGDLFICESCYPYGSSDVFIIDTKNRSLIIKEKQFIRIGQDTNEGVNLLKKYDFIEKYRLNNIVKYGKKCGIYIKSESDSIERIGIWTGPHKTDKEISLYSQKEDILNTYGANFTIEQMGKYRNCYHYKEHNIIFVLTKVGIDREIVTEMILK